MRQSSDLCVINDAPNRIAAGWLFLAATLRFRAFAKRDWALRGSASESRPRALDRRATGGLSWARGEPNGLGVSPGGFARRPPA